MRKGFNRNLLLTFHIVCVFSFNSFSQQSIPATGKTPPAKSSFQVFFEKVYLHLDRQVYASGEDIWFKAYLVNGQSNWLTGSSNNLYVELISPEATLIDRKVIRLDNGLGVGDFQLKDSIPEGKYRVRAYTNWMRNFRDCFIFEKEIDVHSSAGVKPKIKLQGPKPEGFDVRFFPEGGALVANVAGLVGFKAIDSHGKGCDVKGKVVSSDGDTVGWFESSHLGMGKFNFLPIQDKKYHVEGVFKSNNTPFKTDLPAGLPKGFSMHVTNQDTANMIVTVSTNTETLNEFIGQDMLLVGQAYGKTCFKAVIKLANPQVNVRVPKSYFPAGVAGIILMDSKFRPYSERLVFIEPKNNVTLAIIPDKKKYLPRESIVLKIKATNQQDQPVKASFSLSAVDAGQVPENTGSIVSYLMLESEIKGNIENPIQYFDAANVNRYKQLDLLLLTQGWRNFVWRQLADSAIRIKYMVEPGFTISGKVRQKLADKPLPDMAVTMFMPGATKNKVMFTKTDSLGKYYIDGVEFYNNKNVILTATNNKGKKTGWILRDSLYRAPISIPMKPGYENLSQPFKQFSEEADLRRKTLKKYTLADTIELSEVLITARSKKDEDQLNSHMVQAANVDYSFTIGPDDYTYYDIGAFLMDKVPGAEYADYNPTTNPEDSPNRIAFRSMGEKTKPRFALDNFSLRSDEEDVVYNLSLDQIDKIFVSRMDPLGENGLQNRFVISVFTKSGARAKKEFFTLNEYINGYYQARVFYSPQYSSLKTEGGKPDLRTTVYWGNNLVTNDNGEATVTYYNTDKPTRIKIVAEGVTEKGIPVTGAVGYDVKLGR